MTLPALIAGRYELIDDPLRGSMGEVFHAYDTRLDRRVAVKLIHRDLLGGDLESELVRRFRREARLTAKAAHPGVPAIHDVGVDGDRHYVVMELVEGATLRDLLDAVSPLPVVWTAFIASQICAVLAHTHAQALIHRDLKPDNVMICFDGSVKVVDFGVAIVTEAGSSTRLTPPGATAGDARYQAPERLLGVATPHSDLYSLGRIVQDMLRGHADPPAELLALSKQLTRQTPQRRPANALEVFGRLEPWLDTLPPLPGFVTGGRAEPVRIYERTSHHLPSPGQERSVPRVVPPSDAMPRQIRARAERYADADQFDRAARILEDAIAATDDSNGNAVVDLRRDLATVLARSGDARRTVDACDQAIEALTGRIAAGHPAAAAIRLSKARGHVTLGELAEARETYQALIDDLDVVGPLTPVAVEARIESAALLAAQGDLDRAAAMLNRVLEDPNSAADPARAKALLAAMRRAADDAPGAGR
ncbi:protein kinase domain-containing protein [Catellatospora chokoriensis]|uniref:non-specific serine/threonine protein kinase n=1 Tax=Catellatospora chokoriensis TaxID=310353 RepID=A0A8J3JUX5_9ACTN|nr:protein kinase [Catellatospora chokoriensis]GIF91506.1 protein kinase [Catellatospora chokoriensis]